MASLSDNDFRRLTQSVPGNAQHSRRAAVFNCVPLGEIPPRLYKVTHFSMNTLKRAWAYLEQHPNQAALAVFVTALIVYILTLAPTVLWGGGDFATFQTRIALMTIDADIWGHPLYVLAAHPFTWLPIGDLAYRANLSAAVFSALALGLLFRLIYDVVGSLAAASLSTLMLMVAHTFWTYAVMPKSYSLNSVLLVAILYWLFHWRRTKQDRFLGAAGFLLGFAALSHTLFILFLPAPLVYIFLCRPPRRWYALLKFILTYLVGVAPYLALTIMGKQSGVASNAGVNLIGSVFQVLTTPAYWPTGMLVFVGALVYQFPVTLIVGVIGLMVAWRRDRAFTVLLTLIYLADVVFTWSWLPGTPQLSSYVQNFHFYLPSYIIVVIWAGYGFDWLLRWRPWTRLALAGLAAIVFLSPIVVYAAAPILAKPFLATFDVRQLPGRDATAYLFSPWKNEEYGARELGEQILATLPPDALIVADYNIYEILNFLHAVENRRPDVGVILLQSQIEDNIFRQLDRSRPLFIPDTQRYYNLDIIQKYYHIEPYQSIYQLIPKVTS